jgi:hypothetical protein
LAEATPPSNVIQSIYQKYNDVPPPPVIYQTAEKVLLSIEEVDMWFQYLQQKYENRANGAKKAAETRKKNKK